MRTTRTFATAAECLPVTIPLAHQGRTGEAGPHGPEPSRVAG